jgi:2-methylisocitrate lyase-like PEP mutase family enzyme
MNTSAQRKKAEAFLSLHTNGRMLVLPNIWDPIGARILQAKGYPAVATASSAISSSLGYEDGQMIGLSTLISIISRIANSVDVPVTADIESGYGETIEELKKTIVQVIDSGVVGINIEDSLEEGGALRPMGDQCERIAVVREVSDKLDMHLVINARVDSFFSGSFPTTEARIEEAVVRAKAYSKAGADCIYPIGPGDAPTLKVLRDRIASPMNILASANAEPLTTLREIGINRASFGPYVFRSCLKKFIDIVEALHNSQGYECFSANMLSRNDTKAFLIHGHEQDAG